MLSLISRTVFIATVYAATSVFAYAQSNETNPKPAPSWLVNCSNQLNQNALNCVMSQTVLQSDTRQRIVSARIFKGEQGNYAMNLSLPHGLDLTRGVTLSIDGGNTSQHTINTADANGAYSNLSLEDGQIAAMKAGNLMEVVIGNVSGDIIKLNLSLDGFSANFALLDR